MEQLEQLSRSLQALSVYRPVLDAQPVSLLKTLLGPPLENCDQYFSVYGQLLSVLYQSESGGNLSTYIDGLLQQSENFFSLACACGEFEALPTRIKDGAYYDICALFRLATLPCDRLKDFLASRCPSQAMEIRGLPSYEISSMDSRPIDYFRHIIENYKTKGYGVFSRGHAFYLDAAGEKPTLRPVVNPDAISLRQLKGYESQKQKVLDNTRALLNGFQANNVLLYGDRGTGKSSTVKAVVNEFSSQGLRLIEVSKENLKHLGAVIDVLAKVPMKFIVFIDDLSFSGQDDSYTTLKAVLEGSSNKLPKNMALYATTNRRHLITETFSAREGDEIHLKDTIDEAVSLSDRFGITITYISPPRAEYLEIVFHLAADFAIGLDKDTIIDLANKWSVSHGGFSPRIAKQFVDHLAANYQTTQGDKL